VAALIWAATRQTSTVPAEAQAAVGAVAAPDLACLLRVLMSIVQLSRRALLSTRAVCTRASPWTTAVTEIPLTVTAVTAVIVTAATAALPSQAAAMTAPTTTTTTTMTTTTETATATMVVAAMVATQGELLGAPYNLPPP
jgi:hypothetical protein